MLRSGLILGVAGLAASATLLVQPVIRDGSDFVSRQDRALATIKEDVSLSQLSTSPILFASVGRPERGTAREAAEQRIPTRLDKASSKLPRRLMKEGCEGAISSLAGPEARRMLPGRCIA